MATGLNSTQESQVEDKIDVKVERYFNKYLTEVWPKQQKQIHKEAFEETTTQIELHDRDSGAHGGVESKVNRILWLAVGASTGVGGLAGYMAKIIAG